MPPGYNFLSILTSASRVFLLIPENPSSENVCEEGDLGKNRPTSTTPPPPQVWSLDQQCPWGACWECQILGLTSDGTCQNLGGKKIPGGPCAGEGLRSRGAALQALHLQCLFS